MTPLVSVVIPTRNRQLYAASLVQRLLAVPDDRLEVIVQDNSDDADDLPARLGASLYDGRLRYRYVLPPVSSRANFDEAIRPATGDFLAIVGDDDVVNPEILAVCEWAAVRDIDAVCSYAWAAQYYWPDFRASSSGDALSGSLVVRPFEGSVAPTDPAREQARCARMGGMGMQRLPKVYLGIVRRTAVARVLPPKGTTFPGTCPDMFYAVAAAEVVRRSVVFDYPIIVPGGSAPSTTGDRAMGTHQGPLESAIHLRAREPYAWPALLPRFYSYETFYAESALAAVTVCGRDDLARVFNLPLLYAVCWRNYPEYRAETAAAWRVWRGERGSTWQAGVYLARAMGDQLARRLRPGTAARSRERTEAARLDASTSAVATDVLAGHLRATGRNAAALLARSGV